MLVDRITKETTDISRDFLDMSWWLDEGETITHIVSQKVILGMSGWTEAPYPPPGGEIPYDPFPLEIDSAVVAAGGTQLEVFVSEGSPSLAYTCQFVLDGSSSRRVTIEMGVQVTGVPLGALGSGPLPSYLAVTIADTPPTDPQPGQLWFDSLDPQLYIWYDDPSSSQWVITTSDKGGLSTDAPYDGGIYSRRNGVWVLASGFGSFLPLDGGAPVTGTTFGTGIGQVPAFVNLKGSGHPGLLLVDRLVLDMALAKDTDFANANLRLVNTIGAHDQTQNYALQIQSIGNGTDGGLCYAGFLIAQKQAGSSDVTVGLNASARDFNVGPSSTSGGGVIGLELSTGGSRADDAANARAFGGVGVRVGIHLTGIRANASDTTPTEIAHGIWVGASIAGSTGTISDPYTYFDSLIGFVLGTQVRTALDTRGMIAPTGSADPVSAVTMSAGHIIDFNGSASLVSNPGGAYLQYRTATQRLYYVVAGVDQWSVDASGNVRARGTVTGSTTP
jgi:hypothetical protein